LFLGGDDQRRDCGGDGMAFCPDAAEGVDDEACFAAVGSGYVVAGVAVVRVAGVAIVEVAGIAKGRGRRLTGSSLDG
jgi:hypothetical protein